MKINLRNIIKKTKSVAAVSGTTKKLISIRERRMAAGLSFPNLNYDEETLAREALSLVEDYTMTSYERMATLWNQVRYLDRAGVAGCLVECGTWRGGASGMMALAHLASGNPTRQIHLFDSFEGLPEPDKSVDGERAIHYASGNADGNLASIERCVGPLEDNQHVMHTLAKYPQQLTSYHVGWFENTIPAIKDSIGPIALLRLDGDWYSSTKVCLEGLFPLIQSGGMLVIDDYGAWEGCRKAVDEYLSALPRSFFLNYVDKTARYIIV